MRAHPLSVGDTNDAMIAYGTSRPTQNETFFYQLLSIVVKDAHADKMLRRNQKMMHRE